MATQRARIEKPVALLVLTDNEEVARWARKPIEFGPRSVMSVIVLGPSDVPWVRTEEEALHQPELAVLSALAHGNEPNGLQVALAALQAIATLGVERGRIYYDLIVSSLNEDTRHRLELELQMEPHKYEYRSEFARTYYAEGRAEGRAEGEAVGRAEGKAVGRAEGEAEGKAMGRAEGEAAGKAQALLAVLAARGLEVDATTRERIIACTEPEKLEQWIMCAATASSLGEVFGSL